MEQGSHALDFGDILLPVISHDVIRYNKPFAKAWVIFIGKHTWEAKPYNRKVFTRRGVMGQRCRAHGEISLAQALTLLNMDHMLVTLETSLRVHQKWHAWYQMRCCRYGVKQPCKQARVRPPPTAHHPPRLTHHAHVRTTRTTQHAHHATRTPRTHTSRTTRTCKYTRARARAHAHAHTRTHARTHTHMHTHTRNARHTHTRTNA